jgi:hypothetical protein
MGRTYRTPVAVSASLRGTTDASTDDECRRVRLLGWRARDELGPIDYE